VVEVDAAQLLLLARLRERSLTLLGDLQEQLGMPPADRRTVLVSGRLTRADKRPHVLARRTRTCGSSVALRFRRGEETLMITVTDRAVTELEDLLRNQNAPEGEGVKLVPSGDGRVQMTIAPPGTGDEVTQKDGHPLLIVDASLADALDGTEVDYKAEGTNGTNPPGFTLRSAETPR
jgi:Fe-S cluster assembly iron-binding protein IscA